ncbi:hypothetical protein [Streptomyces marokkonensis]|uniref:hypothetical protein n=1 Tax=Streptomyces marokkonensis TaxID=324855 RepID=UPI00142ECA30|nr:hypothetical protein [Streptomyces marokkonensis]
MTPKRPPAQSAPHTAEPPARTGFLPRIRGRHRKPRPRKVLLAAGGLALAAGAVSLVRLTSAPDGGGDIGVEAGPHPTPPAGTTRSGTPPPNTTAPEASPSSPKALGGKNETPLAPPEPSSAPRTPTAVPETTRTTSPTPPAPSTSGPPGTPRAPGPPPPEHREPPPHRPEKPAPTPEPTPEPDPGLCVPVIGLCVGGGSPD